MCDVGCVCVVRCELFVVCCMMLDVCWLLVDVLCVCC